MIPPTGIIVGLDARDGAITVVVGEYTDGDLAVIGMARAETTGMRGGLVVDADALTARMASAIGEAQQMSGVEITSLRLAMSGPHVWSVQAVGAATVRSRGRVVSDVDERNAVAAAVAGAPLPGGRAILHVLAQEFNVDGQDGISRPSGLTIAAPLEAHVLMVTCSTVARDELIACVRTAGPGVTDVVAAPLAGGAMLLSPDEKELGVALLDVERDSIGFAVFERGSLGHLRVVGLSGSPDEETVVELARTAVIESGYAERLHAGVVLTGSQAMVAGLPGQLGRALDLPVEVGSPHLAGPQADSIDGRPFAAAFGLLILDRLSDARRYVETPQRMSRGGWTG